MTPFVFGRDYRPDMMNDEANIFSQMDKFSIGMIVKNNQIESIFEFWLTRIYEIRSDKNWQNFKVGKDFADLLIKEPPEPKFMFN